MKGKIGIYFGMPNVGRLRSRIENAPKELTSDLRAQLTKVATVALNKANLEIRASMIDYIAGREDLKFKSAQHKAQVMSLVSGIFDTVFAVDNDSLKDLLGDADDAPEETATDETAGETATETAGETAPEEAAGETAPEETPADAAPKKGPKKGAEKPADDEFGD